eukprot:jgi/Mesen1/3632/ME000020S03164
MASLGIAALTSVHAVSTFASRQEFGVASGHKAITQPTLSSSALPHSQVWGRSLNARATNGRLSSPTMQSKRSRRGVVVRAEGDEKKGGGQSVEEKKEESNGGLKKQDQKDWKKDEDFRSFLANPSIEAGIKVEKKRAEQRLAELDAEDHHGGFVRGLISSAVRNAVVREKERLERAEEQFKALDIGKLKECFGYDSFYATDVRRFGDGGIFVGNLRRPLEKVKPLLEKKLSEAAGREVVVVQPKSEVDLQLGVANRNPLLSLLPSVLLGVTTLGSVAVISSLFLAPDATFDDFVARVLPFFGGFVSILGVSEIATRWTANHYGVRLSPTLLIPSNWTGCLGAINDFESLLPSKRALFDISAARITSALATSLALTLVAYALDGNLSGGDNALLDAEEVAVQRMSPDHPVEKQEFEGYRVVVTALNTLPAGRLEGGRMAQALLGRRTAARLSTVVTIALGAGGVSGSVLCLVWGFFAAFFRRGEELPAQDEVTPVGRERYIWGAMLLIFCVLTLFPNSAGTFPSALYTPPFWRSGDF